MKDGKLVLIKVKTLTHIEKFHILTMKKIKKMLKANFLKGKDAKP